MSYKTYLIRKGHLWTSDNIAKAEKGHYYIKIGDELCGYGKNLGTVVITGAAQMFKKHPNAIYVTELRVVGTIDAVRNFIAVVEDTNRPDLSKYKCYTIDNYTTSMKEMYDEECVKYKKNQTGSDEKQETLRGANMTEKLSRLMEGYSLDVSDMTDNGAGIKTIKASGHPISKFRVDPLPISSSSPDKYIKALLMLRDEGVLNDGQVESYREKYVSIYDKKNSKNIDILKIINDVKNSS